MKNLALIGLGPHSKRIYLNYLKKHKEIKLKLLVELDSKLIDSRNFLNENGFSNVEILTLKDKFKDCEKLVRPFSEKLKLYCEKLEINYMIISTEPKAHFSYLAFALQNNINVLTDKPIVVAKDMLKLKNINKVRNQYYDLLKLESVSKANCVVMCQRKYHRGYLYVKKLLSEVVSKYQIPLTYIDIYHSDGNWEMLHDLDKENHPYRYGYGKLYHSGYHFIDLLSDLLKINEIYIKDQNKQIMKGHVYSEKFSINDECNLFNLDDYKRIFKDQELPEIYNHDIQKFKFNNYGEKNLYNLFKFTNNFNNTITDVSMNLLHYAFSRRSWIKSRDYYKNNGRVRHERVNIEVGCLLNIQIHSYQSKEIKDRTDSEEEIGGLEHFDILVFRNSDIIGGKQFEKIRLGDLYSEKEKKDFLGYNELSREQLLNDFFRKPKMSDLKDHTLGIEILYACSKELYNLNKNVNKPESIRIRNTIISIEEMKKYSYAVDKDIERKILQNKNIYTKYYNYSCFLTQNDTTYEVYMSIDHDDEIASSLFYKKFDNHLKAMCYYRFLVSLMNSHNIKIIFYFLNHTKIKHN